MDFDVHVVYGIGGYDPTKPNNNIIEQVEVPRVAEPQTDVDAVAAALAELPPTTLAALKTALGLS